MSSDYRVLCLSHDPAIVTGAEWPDREPAIAAAADPANCEQLREHIQCDLLVGRYSYPLVEVACPPSRDQAAWKHYPYHPCGPEWIDASWLRLLAWCHRTAAADDPILTEPPGCWSRQRVHRLRLELGLPDA